MTKDARIDRRRFVGVCTSSIAAVATNPGVLAAQAGTPKLYRRSRLLGRDGQPLPATRLLVGETYLFNYPFQTTPCFLLNLGHAAKPVGPLATENGQSYFWPGGVGPNQSIVAFAAICAHKMSHPARSVSFINYRHQAVNYDDQDKAPQRGEQLIYCCSEKSVYDPNQGARVLGGPAKQPLTTILIEHDENTDELFALGTMGAEMYEKFFQTFGNRLQLEYGVSDVQSRAQGETVLTTLKDFSAHQMLCGG